MKFQQPTITALSPSNCSMYRETAKKFPGVRACQQRFTDAACNACLEGVN